jgi:predicted nucleic-acid-binding protein
MKAVDTNIIVRLLTRDDEKQFQKAHKIFNNHDIFIADTVLLETEWVLRFAYKFKPAEINRVLKKLLGLSNVYLANSALVYQSLQWYESGLDFADALHLALSEQSSSFLTFDSKFIRQAKGLSECLVEHP